MGLLVLEGIEWRSDRSFAEDFLEFVGDALEFGSFYEKLVRSSYSERDWMD